MKDFSQESRVEFAGIHGLESFDKAQAMQAAENYLKKFEKITKHPSRLLVHVKVANVEGTRQRYTVNSKIVTLPGKMIESSHEEWDLMSAMQKSLSVLEKEIIKHFKK